MQAPIRFGNVDIRPAERQIWVDGQPAALGSRAFDLLLALIDRRERVVGKQELLDLVWPGLVVEENNLQVQISTLRRLLGSQAIATVPGRGYRFSAPVEDDSETDSPIASLRSAVAAAASSPRTTNLPEALPALIGRAQEVADIHGLLREHRLVTLTGPGGIGKTTLARAIANALRDEYVDGVWLIELAAATEPHHVFAAAAQTMGMNLSATRPPPRAIAELLVDQRLLLVLDNCEHVLESVAVLAEALLAGAPGVRLLATSQEPLRLTQERQFRLDALAVPEADAAIAEARRLGAVALFVDRTQAMDSRFELSDGNLAAVVDICRRLDGIPLAIELAAARLPLLGVNGLQRHLDERFRVLTAGSRLALPRHQTLHAALDWSHGLLSADEQAVFRRLGVFAGGFTLEAAQQVAADPRIDRWEVLEHLGALVDKSLVVARGGDAPRYMLLETARAYALEKLAEAGERVAIWSRHAHWLRALFEQLDEERYGDAGALSQDDYIDRALPELDNLRVALAWASGAGGDGSVAIALAAASAEAFFHAGPAAEGLSTLRGLMPRVAATADDALTARFWLAVTLVGFEGRFEDDTFARALEAAESACRRHRWMRRLACVLLRKAWRWVGLRDSEAARTTLAEAAAIERPDWPGWLRCDRRNTHFHFSAEVGDFEAALADLRAMKALLPPLGEQRRESRLILNNAVYFNIAEQWDDAESLLSGLVDDAWRRRDRSGVVAWAYGPLILALTQLGRLGEAGRRLREALPLWRGSGIMHVWSHVVIRLVAAEGRTADAMRLVGAEDVSARQFGRHYRLALRIRAETRALIEAAEPDAARRDLWRREGEALDEASIVALWCGDGESRAGEPRGA